MDRDRDALESVLDLAAILAGDLDGVDRDRFLTDVLLQDATNFRLLHVGEQAGRLSLGLTLRHPEVGWVDLVGMRNILAHAYDRVDPAIVWDSIAKDLPALLAACRAELGRMDDPA